MAWASIAASCVGSLTFIDDINSDGSSIMTSVTFHEILRGQGLPGCLQTHWQRVCAANG